MMVKNGLLTFICACIPGAGEMYQGYMKRGLSLMLIFAAVVAASSLLGILAVLVPIVWAYSFFDTFHLRNCLKQNAIPQDGYVWGEDTSLTRFLETRHALVGWGIVALGIYGIYSNFIRPAIGNLLSGFDNAFANALNGLLWNLPALIVALLVIWLGLWLVRGERPVHTTPTGEVPPVPDEEA